MMILPKSREIDEETRQCKGCINIKGYNPKWNITHFEDNIGYGGWKNNKNKANSYPLKFFIEERFKYLCHTYGINPETLELIEP